MRHKTKRGKEIYTRATTNNNNPFVAKRFAKRERKRRRGHQQRATYEFFFIFSIEEEGVCAFFDEDEDEEKIDKAKIYFKSLESSIVRTRLLQGLPRIDGRDLDTVRPITIETGLLKQAHGSALFTRGETQSIGVATIDSLKLSQLLDTLHGDAKDPFMLHYNFPPYSVGEAGMIGSPKRREIGHGKLARRALEAVLPDPQEFEYAIRVVSEITESNGSSSMATVCGTSMSLMDAGVPLELSIIHI